MTRFISKLVHHYFLPIFIALTLGWMVYPVQAQTIAPSAPGNPQTPETPVWAPDLPELQTQASAIQPASIEDDLPALKAVVFVGPIDGENGTWTLEEIQSAQVTAAALRSYGVNVQEFYPNQPNGTWENIKKAAEGANFLIYRGHGIYWSAMPTPIVGGFMLKGDQFISNDMIRNELHPAKNFIVMLYGCFTAGSAGNDTASIDLAEARRRVEMYSDPFLDIGAGGYYADWLDNAFTSYVHTLFQGKTQRQAYEGFTLDYNSSRVWRDYHKDHPTMDLWLGWDEWYAPKPNWNNAFAGYGDKTLTQLFVPTAMALSSNSVYYLAQSDSPVREFPVEIQSTTGDSFDWTATVQSPPAWLISAGPTSGVAGQKIVLKIDPSKGSGGSLTIHVETGTENIVHPAQDITVTLNVVAELHYVHLPIMIR